ncbi:hypothetical protein J4N46_11525 [Capnocytophaga sp. Marseille-Q4570]|jgi:hypothetical protein|uniref:Uncharacterized protein n=1 Tax=Capnocytophaga bilenii TaxID=2819369 RepID=A0ABS3Q0G3_9FLAO|nr:hypothetical protein [Capnocytophaga bilenii]MBO1885025.1 hypothetical protein [Capnocytophaga bilenii]
MEDYTLLRERWNEIVERLSHMFTEGETLDVDAIIYLIGIQELGQLGRKYEKDEKVDLMHIAICKLLEPFGYYQYQFTDPDGWPHYELVQELPALKPGEQTILMKKAIVQYFVERDFFEN